MHDCRTRNVIVYRCIPKVVRAAAAATSRCGRGAKVKNVVRNMSARVSRVLRSIDYTNYTQRLRLAVHLLLLYT